MTKYICDICGKEMNYGDVVRAELEFVDRNMFAPTFTHKELTDMCMDCCNKIKEFAKTLKPTNES